MLRNGPECPQVSYGTAETSARFFPTLGRQLFDFFDIEFCPLHKGFIFKLWIFFQGIKHKSKTLKVKFKRKHDSQKEHFNS